MLRIQVQVAEILVCLICIKSKWPPVRMVKFQSRLKPVPIVLTEPEKVYFDIICILRTFLYFLGKKVKINVKFQVYF